MKRLIALMLAVILPIGLVGCGGSETSSTTASPAATESDTLPAATESDTPPAGSKTSITGNIITDDPVTLDVWMIADREAHFTAAIEAYTTEHPNVKIEMSYLDTNTLKNNAMTAAASNTLPDCYYSYSGTIGSYYPLNGYAIDMSSYAAEHGWDDLFLQSALELCSWDGKIYGIPMTYNTFDVLYRQDLFAQYGLEAPVTWEEFENCLAVLKENGVTPWAIGANGNWDLQRVFSLVLEAYAGAQEHDTLAVDWTGDWSSNEAVKNTFEKIKEWYDNGYFIDGFLTLTPNDARNLWYQGEAAMRIDGFIWNMISNDREMSQYGVFHIPSTVEGQTTRCSTYNTCMMLNPSLSDDRFAVALDFFEYALVNPAFDEFKSYPVAYKAVSHPDAEGFELLEQILEDNITYGTMPTLDTALPTSVHTKLSSALEMYITGSIGVDEAAAMIQAEMEAYLAG